MTSGTMNGQKPYAIDNLTPEQRVAYEILFDNL
jgi:hypothetical protein